MTKDEIKHLGRLARIELNESELEAFSSEIDAILSYVGQIKGITADGELTKDIGPVHNVLRADEVTNEPGAHTAVLTGAFPKRSDDFLQVKKILTNND